MRRSNDIRRARDVWATVSVFARCIFARNVAKAYAEAIPGIDGGDNQCQVGQFLFAKMLAHLLKNLVGHMIHGEQRQLLGQSRAARSRSVKNGVSCQTGSA